MRQNPSKACQTALEKRRGKPKFDETESSKYRVSIAIIFWAMSGLLAACDNGEQKVTVNASEYGKDWGFTVSSFELTCRVHDYGTAAGRYRLRPHVIIIVNGNKYALNGAAMGSGFYTNARKIMKRDEYGATSASSIFQVLQRGLDMCRH